MLRLVHGMETSHERMAETRDHRVRGWNGSDELSAGRARARLISGRSLALCSATASAKRGGRHFRMVSGRAGPRPRTWSLRRRCRRCAGSVPRLRPTHDRWLLTSRRYVLDGCGGSQPPIPNTSPLHAGSAEISLNQGLATSVICTLIMRFSNPVAAADRRHYTTLWIRSRSDVRLSAPCVRVPLSAPHHPFFSRLLQGFIFSSVQNRPL
jgi:hypothetical protein